MNACLSRSESSLQRSWAVRHHEGMNAYSEDLRKKIVEAVKGGCPRSKPLVPLAWASPRSNATWPRYAEEGRWPRRSAPALSPSSTRARGGSWRSISGSARRRPCHRGASSCGGRAGWRSATPQCPGPSSAWDGAEKKIGGCEREGRIPEGCLADDGRRGDPHRAAGVLKDECSTNTSLAPLYAWSRRGERALCSLRRNWGRTSRFWRA
jgi:hypothetical protein